MDLPTDSKLRHRFVEYALIVLTAVALSFVLTITVLKPALKGDAGERGMTGKTGATGSDGQTLILLPDTNTTSVPDGSSASQPHDWNTGTPENVNQFDVAPCWPAEDPNHCGEEWPPKTTGVPISPYDGRYQ